MVFKVHFFWGSKKKVVFFLFIRCERNEKRSPKKMQLRDTTGLFVDTSRIHCFSGETDYPTYDLLPDNTLFLVASGLDCSKDHVHVICPSRDQLPSIESLSVMGFRSARFYVRDKRYLSSVGVVCIPTPKPAKTCCYFM